MSLTAMEPEAELGPAAQRIRLRFTPDGRYLVFESATWTSLWDVAAREFRFNLLIPGVNLYRERVPNDVQLRGTSAMIAGRGSKNWPISTTLLPGAAKVWVTGRGSWLLPADRGTFVGLDAFRRFEFPLDGDPARSLPADPEHKNTVRVQYTIERGIPTGTIDVGFLEIPPVTDPFEPHRLAVSPDGKTILGTVRTIQYQLIRGGGGVTGVDGSATPPFHLALLDSQTLHEQAVLIEDFDGQLGVFSPDGSLVAQPLSRQIRVWNTATYAELPNAIEPGEGLEFLHDNRTLVVTQRGMGVLYELSSGQKLREIDLTRGHAQQMTTAAAFSPTQPVCATVSYDGDLILRELERGDVLSRRGAHQQTCEDVAFSPDGQMLATVSVGEKSIKLWQVPGNLRPPGNEDGAAQVVQFTTTSPNASVARIDPVVEAVDPEMPIRGNNAQTPSDPVDPAVTDTAMPIDTNSIGIQLALLPAGEFQMGALDHDTQADPNERPRHRVRFTQPFAIGIYEVTVGQFREFTTATGYQTDAERDGKGGPGYDASSQQFIDAWQPEFNWQNVGFLQSSDQPVINVSGRTRKRSAPGSATWKEPSTACRQRRNGSTPAARERTQSSGLEMLRRRWREPRTSQISR